MGQGASMHEAPAVPGPGGCAPAPPAAAPPAAALPPAALPATARSPSGAGTTLMYLEFRLMIVLGAIECRPPLDGFPICRDPDVEVDADRSRAGGRCPLRARPPSRPLPRSRRPWPGGPP